MNMRSASTVRSGNTILSLQKGLAVLRAFSTDRAELGVTELSRILGLNKTVVYKLIHTFNTEGFLQRDPVSREYRLGPRVMEVASVFLRTNPLAREGSKCVSELSRATWAKSCSG